jgi:hypothetical protein
MLRLDRRLANEDQPVACRVEPPVGIAPARLENGNEP